MNRTAIIGLCLLAGLPLLLLAGSAAAVYAPRWRSWCPWPTRSVTWSWPAWPGAAGSYLSVNVSPLQLLDPSFPERVLGTIGRRGLLPHHLVLEVTENALADESYVIPALQRLRAAGLRTAIDDVGTGYSSLRCLHRLPADIIKIDRSYIQDINRDSSAGRLVETPGFGPRCRVRSYLHPRIDP